MAETRDRERHGSAETAHARRYLQQLCKHWSHKFPVEAGDDAARVDLPTGLLLMRAEATRLLVTIKPSPEADGARLEQVFQDHINRFAFREAPLPLKWTSEEKTV